MNILSLNHDFKVSISCNVSILIRIRCLVSVYFAYKNTRSGSNNIAGIENTLIAIFKRYRSRVRCLEASH